jgi:8-oxo-dGTP pyrophosphatase MutT (NUDIX family)
MEPRDILSDRESESRLTRDWVIERLRCDPPAERRRSNEDARAADGGGVSNPERLLDVQGPLIPAAVLVPLVNRADGITVLLTKRTEHLNNHAGQIAFPGGRVDDGDTDAEHTALRETEEEVGLDPSHVEVIGRLDDYVVGTGYLVKPIIAMIDPPFELDPHDGEVAEVFEVPLAFILDRRNHQRHFRESDGKRRYFYAIPYKDYFIWGATAGMLRDLRDRLED